MTSDPHVSHVCALRTSAVRSRLAQHNNRLGGSDAKLGPLPLSLALCSQLPRQPLGSVSAPSGAARRCCLPLAEAVIPVTFPSCRSSLLWKSGSNPSLDGNGGGCGYRGNADTHHPCISRCACQQVSVSASLTHTHTHSAGACVDVFQKRCYFYSPPQCTHPPTPTHQSSRNWLSITPEFICLVPAEVFARCLRVSLA